MERSEADLEILASLIKNWRKNHNDLRFGQWLYNLIRTNYNITSTHWTTTREDGSLESHFLDDFHTFLFNIEDTDLANLTRGVENGD